MRLLLCHNFYQQAGGEDACFADEGLLLEKNGHTVIRYEKNNDHITGVRALASAAQAIWNQQSYRKIRQLIREHAIDLVHCTNTFPVISPSVYYACNHERVPVVQSLHNYRLVCANAYFLRDAHVCENCLGKRLPISAVKHACYRGSRLASLAVATMQATHGLTGTWRKRVDQFIALTDFGRDLFIRHGLPGDRIIVKPNFVDPVPPLGSGSGDYAIFVGRLSPEKGIELLLKAWRSETVTLPLRIVGDGPLLARVKSEAASNPLIQLTGHLTKADVLTQMQEARFLVLPSLWYEGLPRTLVEAFAVGTPVLASQVGPLTQLVRPEGGGVTFELGNVAALVAAVEKMLATPETASSLRPLARAEFELRYSAEENYRLLMLAYANAKVVSARRFAGKKASRA
jgi:glycosyltransferase involved in cell wall biosynthesis